ncbi:DUF4148 domain-containing protein [Undibacterium sp. Jales W-56]|uniref:DUF4148 domain-containing protein n=1 Tax=Undibacterium sp. Jales W-56 TaxID=2897325 RepID=UPI0021CFDFBB|nr:DUF4148 domain-containing protein [Undibacterium sp. Jales W-56]MCU6433957.1 DUF4148 domain-containing protein [Undibacterium sp. Jales W-56]
MNAKNLIAAVALIAAGVTTGTAAFAGDYQVGGEAYVSFPIPDMIKSTAEVRAELVKARAEGQPVGGESYTTVATSNATNGKTRSEVLAELSQARNEGFVVGGESYVAFAPAAPAHVTADTVQTAKNK